MTALEIANLALAKVGHTALTGFGDTSNAAAACRLLFVPTSEEVLSQAPWHFAKKRAAPTLAADQSPAELTEFDYLYDLPDDCINVLELLPAGSSYRLEGNQIYTDVAHDAVNSFPRIVYVHDLAETDGSGYPQLVAGITLRGAFVSALATRLAHQLAVQITKNGQLAQMLFQEYLAALRMAVGDNAQESNSKEEDNIIWSQAGGR